MYISGGNKTVNKFYASLIIGIVISVILTLVVAVPYVLLRKQEGSHCVYLNLGCNCSVRRQTSWDSEHPDDTAFIDSNTWNEIWNIKWIKTTLYKGCILTSITAEARDERAHKRGEEQTSSTT